VQIQRKKGNLKAKAIISYTILYIMFQIA